jgi:type II secretory pathway pseudopilin PulG
MYYPAPSASLFPQSQQSPKGQRGFSMGIIVLLVLLAILLIGGGGFLIYSAAVYQPHQQQTQATAMTNAQATVAVQNPYTHSGTLDFSDALTANNQGQQWDENTNCAFTGSTYHVIAPDPHYSDYCIANATDYGNFAYEVQMKILKGDGGGILFHVESTNPNEYYEFDVFEDGSYGFYKADAGKFSTLTSGNSAAIHQGLNKTNVLGVVVGGSTFTLYINGKSVDSVTDSTFTHGQIGVEASVANQATEVSFTNAKVWKL